MITPALFIQYFLIRATLMFLEPEIPYSLAAEKLILGTAAQESHLGQMVGNDKGLVMYQMLLSTEKDIWENFLNQPKHKALAKKIHDLQHVNAWYYAVAIVRVHYWRFTSLREGKIDASLTVDDMARLWKTYYNTKLGRGTVGDFKANYHKLIEGREIVH